MTASRDLELAIRDYRLLLDWGYPEKATLKLVGDRFTLSREERMILFRGVASSGRSEAIKAKIIPSIPRGGRVGIDGYNILFTLFNYRKGRPLFISTDGLLRDAGGVHGRLKAGEPLQEAVRLLLEALAALDPEKVWLWLDAPVSGSGRLAEMLRTEWPRYQSAGELEVSTVPSADPFVKGFTGDGVATSDSAVAISAKSPVFDLARTTLERFFRAEFYRIDPESIDQESW